MVFKSYDIMATTARRQPEGSLVYVTDQTDLYVRVRDGVRQVQVIFFYSTLLQNTQNCVVNICFLMFLNVLYFLAGELYCFTKSTCEYRM